MRKALGFMILFKDFLNVFKYMDSLKCNPNNLSDGVNSMKGIPLVEMNRAQRCFFAFLHLYSSK